LHFIIPVITSLAKANNKGVDLQIGAFAAKIVYLKEWDDCAGASVEIMKVPMLSGICIVQINLD
jgi:hypothetical protein